MYLSQTFCSVDPVVNMKTFDLHTSMYTGISLEHISKCYTKNRTLNRLKETSQASVAASQINTAAPVVASGLPCWVHVCVCVCLGSNVNYVHVSTHYKPDSASSCVAPVYPQCIRHAAFIIGGARGSSVVRALAQGAMGRRIDPSLVERDVAPW